MSRQIINEDYSRYDFKDPETFVFRSQKGLTRSTVEEISRMKNEPEWMRNFRLKAYDYFMNRPMPGWEETFRILTLTTFTIMQSPLTKWVATGTKFLKISKGLLKNWVYQKQNESS